MNIVSGSIEDLDELQIHGSFQWTNSELPRTLLLITSAFVFVGIVVDIRPASVAFLLFCGYAAHYLHSGLAKLRIDPLYYMKNNNPIYLFMNAYQIGWLSFLNEQTVLKIGRYSERVKPVLNMAVVGVEIGVVFMLVLRDVAILIAMLTFGLHVSIFIFTGDNFWKWMVVNLAVVAGLLFVPNIPAILSDLRWYGLFEFFTVLLARG